jgi:hypothetical protein
MPEIPESPRKRFTLRGRPDPDRDLHVCVNCGRDYVNVVARETLGEERWWIRLRCGECDASREVTVSNAIADRLDDELDRRARIVGRALARLERDRMTAWVEAMSEALRRDLIDAGDFAVSS